MKKKLVLSLVGLVLVCGLVQVVRAAGGYTATKSYTLTVASALVISTASPLPEAVAGQAYPSVTFTATGGIPPYVWSVTSGSTLPAGLTLSTGGVLAGSPTTAGSYTFSITVTDGSGKQARADIGK